MYTHISAYALINWMINYGYSCYRFAPEDSSFFLEKHVFNGYAFCISIVGNLYAKKIYDNLPYDFLFEILIYFLK